MGGQGHAIDDHRQGWVSSPESTSRTKVRILITFGVQCEDHGRSAAWDDLANPQRQIVQRRFGSDDIERPDCPREGRSNGFQLVGSRDGLFALNES